MYGAKIWCLMYTKPIVSDDVRDELLAVAYLMLKTSRTKQKLHTDECEGMVKTKFQRARVGDTLGILFAAHLETNAGELDVTYIVRDRDLEEMGASEEGAWLDQEFEEMEPEEQFEELKRVVVPTPSAKP